MRKSATLLFNSLRFKMVTGLMLIMLPMVLILIYNNYYSIQVVRNQVAQSNSNMISLYMGLVDRTLDDIDNLLLKYASVETGLYILDRPAGVDLDLYNIERIWQFNQLLTNTSYYKGLDYLFIYSPVNHDLLFAPNFNGTSSTNNQPVKDAIVSLFKQYAPTTTIPNRDWTVFHTQEHDYLLRIVKTGNLYIGAAVYVGNVMGPMNLLDLGAQGRALLVDDNYMPLVKDSFFRDHQIELTYTPKDYRLSGTDDKYLVIGEKSGKGGFGLVAVLPDQSILEKLPYLQRIIWLIALGSVLILLIAIYLLRKIVLLPINRIVMAMRKIKEGFLEIQIPKSPTSNEFEMMNETFNSMVSDIQKLKIDIYEEQLINKKAELRHLQLQINPHFFLNSLNVIYYMAQEKKFGLIQELAFSLIRYFRFMFRSQTDYIPLQDELNHTEHYLKIQELRFPESLTFSISVQDEVLHCLIPPLMIQSFVENTIKHALNTDELTNIHILIERELVQNEAWLNIWIRDTGKGFEAQVLEKLREEMNLMNEEGEHVGIWNVRRRLRLLYGDQANIQFSNDNGAVVHIHVPVVEGKR